MGLLQKKSHIIIAKTKRTFFQNETYIFLFSQMQNKRRLTTF